MTRLEAFEELNNGNGIVKKPLIVLVFLKFVYFVLEMMPLFLYSLLVNKVLVDKSIYKLWLIVIGYVVVFILTVVWNVINKKYINKLRLKYDLWIKNKLLQKYTKLDYEEYRQYTIGDVKSRIENDTSIVENFFTTHILDFIYSIVYVIVVGGILLFYNLWIALISFIIVPINFLLANALGKKIKQQRGKLWNLQTRYESFLHSTFQNWKDIKANNLEDVQFKELNKHLKEIRRTWFINQIYEHLGLSYNFFSKNLITQLFIYFVGGVFVINGYTEVGTLLIFINFYGQFFSYIQVIGDSIMRFNNDSVSIEKVIEILHFDSNRYQNKKIAGSDIKVENLEFSYNNNEAFLLKDISFHVKKGQHLAIVGESGSGKSTIAKLLTGQIKPNSGSIRIGDVDINAINAENIADKVSIVEQEPILFNMTIRDNLLLVKSNATEEEIVTCCRKARIDDFIETLENKYDTIIGEKGLRLSGGQKQRLSLARAFLQDREIIILDESTSALDGEKEIDVIKEITKLSAGKTLISIAHRLSTILYCDKVFVLKDGEMEAFDTHEKLRGNNKTYDALFENQYTK